MTVSSCVPAPTLFAVSVEGNKRTVNDPEQRFHAVPSFLRIFFLAFVGLFIAGSLTQAYAEPYELVVNKGSGGGPYEPSTLVHISAYPYDTSDPATSTSEPAVPGAPIRIFDRWVGDTAAVKDVLAPDTTLVMPSQNTAFGSSGSER